MRGEKVDIQGPNDAIARGIGMVHQHFMLVPVMTVTENVMLGVETTRGGVVLNRDEVARRIEQIGASNGLEVPAESLHQGPAGRRPATRRNHQGPLSQGRHPDSRRAHRRSDAAGSRRVVQDPPVADRAGQVHHPDHPQAAGSHGGCRPHHRPAAGPDGGHGEAQRNRPAAPGQHDGRPGREPDRGQRSGEAGRGRPRRQGPRRPGRAPERRSQWRVVRRAAQAKSSALPVCRATARPNWSTRSPACGRRSAARSRSLGEPVKKATPREITEKGVAHVPEDRQKHGLVLSFPGRRQHCAANLLPAALRQGHQYAAAT